jgi:hypothetical protein
MKATSIKEYLENFQPDMSLYLETASNERKAKISLKKFGNFFFNFDFYLSVDAASK